MHWALGVSKIYLEVELLGLRLHSFSVLVNPAKLQSTFINLHSHQKYMRVLGTDAIIISILQMRKYSKRTKTLYLSEPCLLKAISTSYNATVQYILTNS